MSRFALTACVLMFAAAVRAEDPAPKESIARAIKTRGLKDEGKPFAQSWKDQGVVEVAGMKIEYTGDFWFRSPDGLRYEMVANVMGQKIKLMSVIAGDKVWDGMDGKIEEAQGEKKDYLKDMAYFLWVTSLTPLNHDKEFKLSSVVGKKVNDKDTLAVLVERKGKPEITLYFDKESGLLAKSEHQVKDEFQGWKDVLQEEFYEDVKEVGGIKVFGRMRVLRDGNAFIDSKPTDMQTVDKLDPKLFEKP